MGHDEQAERNRQYEFEWDEDNEVKLLLRHNVSAVEAEDCFANRPSRRRTGEDYLLLGQTNAGRMLFLVCQQKLGGVLRVYSAREMTPAERRAYRRSKR